MLLLTGLPGVGKTTVIRRLAAALAGKRLGGFYTEEIRVGGQRQGFRLKTFDGQERIIAHVDVSKRQRVGKYGVDVSALDELAGSALAPDPAVAVYLVDEIGKMECLSPHFVAALRALLAGEQTVVASVALKGGGLIDEVKHRSDALLWEVTRENRDRLPGQLLAWLEGIRP
jgi:nucleoside-triphosphatase